MPKPLAREAPRFNGERPSNLRRFLDMIEDLYKDCKIVDAEEKKEFVLRYIDADSEEEWKFFGSFKTGTWEDFKAEIIENYPEAANAAGGTLLRLENLLKNNKDLQAEELNAFLAFKRKFTVEANKLLLPPACISNRELVQKFLGSLSFDFQRSIISRLSMRQSIAATAVAPRAPAVEGEAQVVPVPPLARRKEDQYDLNEVMKEAGEVATNFHGSIAVNMTLGTIPESRSVTSMNRAVKTEAAEPDEMQLKYAGLLDRIVMMADDGARTRKSLEEVLKTLQQGSASYPSLATVSNSSRPSPTPNNGGQGPSGDASLEGACFYCWLSGHRVSECPLKNDHLEQGKIKIVDGKWRLDDGSWVPRDPTNKSPRDKVDSIHALRRQSQNYMGYTSSPGGSSGNVNLGGDDYGQMSIYTNRIVDQRDEMIDKLRNQLVTNVNTPTQTGQNSRQMAMVPPPTLSSEFVQQMSLLMGQLNNQNGGNNSGNNEEHQQYAILRSGKQANQDENAKSGF